MPLSEMHSCRRMCCYSCNRRILYHALKIPRMIKAAPGKVIHKNACFWFRFFMGTLGFGGCRICSYAFQRKGGCDVYFMPAARQFPMIWPFVLPKESWSKGRIKTPRFYIGSGSDVQPPNLFRPGLHSKPVQTWRHGRFHGR